MGIHVIKTTYYTTSPEPSSYSSYRSSRRSISPSSSTTVSSSSASSKYYNHLTEKSAPSGTIHLTRHASPQDRMTTKTSPAAPPLRSETGYETRRYWETEREYWPDDRDARRKGEDRGYEYVKKQVRFKDV